MDILIKSVNSFSFNDITEFCKEGHIEGIQLDYKKDFSKDGLSKLFAAFSNSRGGVIIIGVEEDDKTSKPKVWSGIKNEGKLIDRVHQYASNVEPVPTYDAHITDEMNGNVFILIRVFEGDRTPYYVHNDSNLWVRTGNIRKLIDIASPDYIELLFGKKNKAKLARRIYINRALNIYKMALLRAEKERKYLVIAEKEKFDKKREEEIRIKGSSIEEYKSQYFQNNLGEKTSMLYLIAMPFYPGKALITPLELLNSLDKIRTTTNWGEKFPSYNNMELIPEGLMKFEWGFNDGFILCEQLYSNGLIFYSLDVQRPDGQGNPSILTGKVATIVMLFLKVLNNFYNLINYQGGICGFIQVKDALDVVLLRMKSNRIEIWGQDHKGFLSEYKWDLELDTLILNDKFSLQEYFVEKIKEIYWSFGYKPEQENFYKEFLKESGWLPEDN